MSKYFFIILLLSFMFSAMHRPSSDAILSYTHVLFEWDQVEDAYEYELHISSDESFDNILTQVFEPSLIYIDKENLDWEGEYFWRVRPIYESDEHGAWIGVSRFSIRESLSNATSTMYQEENYQDGITFFGSLDGNFSAAFDKNGNEIWNSADNNLIMYNTNLKGELYGCHYQPQLENSYPGIEFNLDNNFLWEEPNDEFLHHDLLRLDDGNFLGIAESIQNLPIPPTGPWYGACINQFGAIMCNGNNFPWVGDKLIIWDENTKEVLWEWDAFDHYSTNDYDGVYYYEGIYAGSWDLAFNLFRYDWTHINAVSYDKSDNAIYISCRHLSRFTKIYFNFDNYNDPNNGSIIWNIGQYMPSGDVHCGHDLNFSWQHSVSLHNGNIVTLDNGNLSNDFNMSLDHPVSRAIEINPNSSEEGCDAEIVWEHTLPDELFGHASGGAQKLENGNYLVSTVGDGGTTQEISQDKSLVWELKYNLNLGLIHRAYRVSSLYPTEFSVVAPGYTTISENGYEDQPGIYVPYNDVDFEVILYNNGSVSEEYIYTFESISNDTWYEFTENSIQVEAGEHVTINIPGELQATDEGGPYYNDVQLVFYSASNHNLVKTYNFTVHESDYLSNDIPSTMNSYNIVGLYPNPFNPSVNIDLEVSSMLSYATITIYDINGKLVDEIYSGTLASGSHKFIWVPNQISSGKYFIKFESKDFREIKEAIYIK